MVAPAGVASMAVIKRMKRKPGKTVVIVPTLFEGWEEAKAQTKKAKTAEDEAKAALLGALGDADAGEIPELGKMITYLEQGRKGFDHKALLEAHPEFATYEKESRFRVLRSKKLK